MSLVNLRKVGVVSPRVLFTGLDLTIHPGDRIGLVAGNGAGKTTLLRCIAGLGEVGAGEITRRRAVRIGYVEQDVPATILGLTLEEAVRRGLPAAGRESEEWRVGVVLDLLETPAAMRGRVLSALSGGWQRLALLARAWIADPDLLLLDEPTNHLDGDRLAVLESWINHATEGAAMVIASHDRAFLDACTTSTLFLAAEEQRSYAHPFSRARHLLAEDAAARETRHAREARDAERLRRQAGQLRNVGINSGSDLLLKKSKHLTARAAAIERALRPVAAVRSGDIRLASRGTHVKVLMALEDLPVTAPDGSLLFRTGRLKIFQQDRIVLLGANGVGKSMLIRLLLRAAGAAREFGEPIAGVTVSPSLVVGYLDQQMSHLPADDTPHGFIAGRFRLGDQRSLSLLAGAGFDVETHRTRATRAPWRYTRYTRYARSMALRIRAAVRYSAWTKRLYGSSRNSARIRPRWTASVAPMADVARNTSSSSPVAATSSSSTSSA